MTILLLFIAILIAGACDAYYMFCIRVELEELNETMDIVNRRLQELIDKDSE